MNEETQLKIVKFFNAAVLLSGLGIILFTFYLMIESATRSDEKQAEIDRQNLLAKEQRKQQRDIEAISRGIDLANDVVYVQDKRTGICFATEDILNYRGHFTAVECDMIPDEMLHKTKRKAQ